MNKRIVLITGATGGIGRQTALSLAKLDYEIIITGRNKESGENAIREIIRVSNNSKINLILSDISTLEGIHSLANQFKEKYDSLDVLINNAGLASPIKQVTQDGIESDFAVNVVAPFLLTNLLLVNLKRNSSGRVITLTGGEHPSKIEIDNLQAENGFKGLNTYSHSKLVMMALMYEFAQRMKNTNVKINVCYPGQASTNMTRGVTFGMLPVFMKPFFPIFKIAVRLDDGKSAEKASRSSVYLASSSDIEGVNGNYFNSKCKKVNWPEPVLNQSIRKELWNIVEKLSDLS